MAIRKILVVDDARADRVHPRVPRNGHGPVVTVRDDSQEADRRRKRRHGARAHVSEPVTKDRLLEQVPPMA